MLCHLAGSLFLPIGLKLTGRKQLIMTGLTLQTLNYLLTMSGLIFEQPMLILFSFCFFMFGNSISTGGMLYVYSIEILPARLLPIPMLIQSLLTNLLSGFTLQIINKFGIFSLYFFFAVCGCVGLLLLKGFAIETKNKLPSEVIADFRKKKFLR